MILKGEVMLDVKKHGEELKAYLDKYLEFKKSDAYKEKYKWEYSEKYKNTFANLNDTNIFQNKFEDLINSCARANIAPNELMRQPKMFKEILKNFANDLMNNFKDLFNEKNPIEQRVDDFTIKLINLRDKSNWKWNISTSSAIFFLFINNPKYYPVYSAVSPFHEYFELFQVESYLTHKEVTKGIRYKVMLEYIHNTLIPIMNKVTNKKNDALDAQDFIWCVGMNFYNSADNQSTLNDVSLIEKLKLFIDYSFKAQKQGKTTGIKKTEFNNYIYRKTITSSGFGSGISSDTPFFSFLDLEGTQTQQQGIYPVILFTPKEEKNNLEICYGVSAKLKPLKQWDSHIIIKQQSKTKKYEESYIEKSFTITKSADIEKNKTEIIQAIKTVIDEFHSTFTEKGENNMLAKIPLNQILYGPPGTGKTFNTVIKAMEIIDNSKIEYDDKKNVSNYSQLKEEFDNYIHNKQIQFITFHQSYSYEEFIEGIKPKLNCNDIQYQTSTGIFKEIVRLAASEQATAQIKRDIDFSKIHIFKMSLGNTLDTTGNSIFEYCMENNCIALGYGKNVDFTLGNTKENIKNIFAKSEILKNETSFTIEAIDRFKNLMKKGDLVLISNGNNNIRAIGLIDGDYEINSEAEIEYKQFRKVEWLYNGSDIPVDKFLTKKLSQQTIYEFYREDIKLDFFERLLTDSKQIKIKNYVLIIDEINRGNISKIFGELITLVEEDKRKNIIDDTSRKYNTIEVKLPYTQEPFSIPNNLYIIGTMNTSDRSIASVDIALRRRFKFIEQMPDESLVSNVKINDNTEFKKIFNALNEKITILLDRDHQIGHSYFMNERIKNINDLINIWFDEILPLLNEYFYNDWDKLQALLGNATNIKNSDNNDLIQTFIVKKTCNYNFNAYDDIDNQECFNFVDRKNVDFPEALAKILLEK